MADLASALRLYDDYAERSALAGVLTGDSGIAVALAELLTPQDFHDERRQLLFEAAVNVLRGADPMSPAVILAEARHVKAERKLTAAIDEAYISSIDGDAGGAVQYGTLVKKWAWARQYAGVAEQSLVKLQQNPDITEFFAWAMGELQTLAPKTNNGGIVYGWETVGLHRAVTEERMRQNADGTRVLFDWPWATWNRFVRPLRAGMLGVLGAPDGIGKTAILDHIAEHWARKAHVFLVHMEDELEYKLDRRMARYSGLPYDVIEDGKYTPEQWAVKYETEQRLEAAPWVGRLHYYGATGKSAAQIIRELEAKVAGGTCGAVVLDYLNKLQADRRQVQLFGNRNFDRQADDMEQFKIFAERNKLPVFTASQGNKDIVTSDAPSRADMYGSIQVSHKSQLVIMLQRDKAGQQGIKSPSGELIAEPGKYSPIAKFSIDKQNRGTTGDFRMWYQGDRFTFRDLPDGEA
jgi:replicative DNA helicase